MQIWMAQKPVMNGIPINSASWLYTFYVRDASGNIMTTYTKTGSEIENNVLKLDEVMLYGSSRIGTREVNALLSGLTVPTTTFSRSLGLKRYEVSNHLGNVLATFTDRKYQIQSTGVVTGYKTYIASSQDYYPFGMIMNERKWNTSGYRFGFNGKEMDNEVSGDGNQYDYGFRIYNPRIGKFLSVDPLTKDYPFYTPYQFAGNTPVWAFDLDGLEPKPTSSNYNQNLIFANEVTVNAVNVPENINWNAYFTDDIFSMKLKLADIISTGVHVKAVYIQAHGLSGLIETSFGMNSTSGYTFSTMGITGKGIDFYLEYKIKSKEEQQRMLKDNPKFEDQIESIEALESIMEMIDDCGTLILGSCFSGNDSDARGDLTSSLNKLSKGRITIYTNQDGTTVNKKDQPFLDQPLSRSNFLKGWERTEGDDGVTQTNSDFQLNSEGEEYEEIMPEKTN